MANYGTTKIGFLSKCNAFQPDGTCNNFKFQTKQINQILTLLNDNKPKNTIKQYLPLTCYCIKQTFTFPEKQTMKPLQSFIDQNNNKKNEIKESNKQLFQNIPKDSIFIDVGFRNSKFKNSGKWAPCITAQPNMWCVPKQRKASVKEYLMLQGFPETFKQPKDISDHRMKIKIGNSMTVNVIEECMKQIFLALDWIQ